METIRILQRITSYMNLIWFAGFFIFVITVCNIYGYEYLLNGTIPNYEMPDSFSSFVAVTVVTFMFFVIWIVLTVIIKIKKQSINKIDLIAFIIINIVIIYFLYFDYFRILDRFID